MIEIIVVLGIIVIVGGAITFMDFNSFRGDSFRAERTSLVTALESARADALNNIDEKPHGVAIHPGGAQTYVLFEGTSYAAADPSLYRTIAAQYDLNITGAPTEIVFEQLSGDANWDGTFTLGDPQRAGVTSSITINHEGAIIY